MEQQAGAPLPRIGASPQLAFTVGLVVLAVLGLGSLFIGVSDLTPLGLARADGRTRMVFLESRVPRLAAIVLSGSAMAVAGLVMMTLTRNRFVAPSTAGTIPCASLGILLASIWFGSSSVLAKMTVAVVFAMLGSLVLMAIIQQLRFADTIVIPLAGIMFGNVVSAATNYLAFRFDQLQSLSVWLNGDFSGVLRGRYEPLYIVAVVAVSCYLFADQITVAGMGRDMAVNLGLRYDRVLIIGLFLVSIVTAVSVVVVGSIPFIGLVVPNVATTLLGDHVRRVLPATALGGATFVLCADIVSRTIRFPFEIPVGTIVGVVGGLGFLVIVARRHSHAHG